MQTTPKGELDRLDRVDPLRKFKSLNILRLYTIKLDTGTKYSNANKNDVLLLT